MCESVGKFTGFINRAAAAVMPLLCSYCAGAFEIQRKCELEVSLVVFRMARLHDVHTRKHRSTVRSYHKTKTLKYGYCVVPCLPRRQKITV